MYVGTLAGHQKCKFNLSYTSYLRYNIGNSWYERYTSYITSYNIVVYSTKVFNHVRNRIS